MISLTGVHPLLREVFNIVAMCIPLLTFGLFGNGLALGIGIGLGVIALIILIIRFSVSAEKLEKAIPDLSYRINACVMYPYVLALSGLIMMEHGIDATSMMYFAAGFLVFEIISEFGNLKPGGKSE